MHLARAVQYFILLVAHMIHHILHHTIGGFVRVAYGLGNTVYRYAIERHTQIHPGSQHPF